MSRLKTVLGMVLGEARARRLRRWQLALTGGYPNWAKIVEGTPWLRFREAARSGQSVLIATSVGSFLPGTTLESLLAVALTIRGARVDVLLCDRMLPACLESAIRWHGRADRVERDGLTRHLCGSCFGPAQRMYRELGLPVHRYGANLPEDERRQIADLARAIPREDIEAYRRDGIAVGEHALAGALRFFARGSLDEEPQGEFVLRSYFEAALLTARVAFRLFERERYTCAVFHHGIYVPQGLLGEVARRCSVRVVNWNPAYRRKCFIFSHGDTYHHTLMKEPVEQWENLAWSPERERQTMAYLRSRWQGTEDWIWFHEQPQDNLGAIAREIGVDFSKPCIGLLTNVVWDAQLHYPANAFANMLVWVFRTIEYFAKRPDLQLLIRVHPAEIRGTIPSRQPLVAEIRRHFPELPGNVFVIPPESHVSTYAAMLQCSAVLIYGTKMGVELSSMGIPVIVAGEAWIRNKGVSIDAKSAEDYFEILDHLPLRERMTDEQIERARKYAYHFFFRRMIPIDPVEPVEGWPLYRVPESAFSRLMPGASPGLDVVCRGILEGTDFVFDGD